MNNKTLSHLIDESYRKYKFFIGKRYRIVSKWWGVKLGENVQFYGRIYLKKIPGSKILVGNNCRFLSNPFSNQIGINRACMISTLTKNAVIEIGDNCGFSGVVIGSFRSIKIGNNLKCGANTTITDSDWHLDDPRSGIPASIFIGDNVWIGVNCIVLKGVSIGNNTVIGAGSVVTKSIPENVIAAGNPCKVIKYL